MSEQQIIESNHNTEVLNRDPVESFEETLRQIKEVPFVYSETKPNGLSLDYVLSDDGWKFSHNSVEDVSIPLNPQNADDIALLNEAEAVAAADEDILNTIARYVRWWEQGTTSIKEAVAAHIQDRLVIGNSETGEQVDIVNTTQESISDEEQATIEHAVGSVANFTGNKIFERLRGVILADKSRFEEGAWGAHSTYNGGIITINLEAIREAVKADPVDYENRFSPYLPSASPLELSLGAAIAHELGHAMDIRSVEDADTMGVKDSDKMTSVMGGMTGDFSMFDEGLAWDDGKVVAKPNGNGYQRQWKIDPAQEVELRDEVPTMYGRNNPKEDFAETFAILALGGDRKNLPKRVQTMADGLQKLHQADLHGPFLLETKHITDGEPLPAKIPSQLVLKAGVSKELAAV